MEKRTYITILYDIYGDLLNIQEKECFEEYYFNNYSLKEISENINISRSAISKKVNKVEEKLKFYEKKLSLYEKELELQSIINKIKDEKLKKELENL